VWSELCVQRRSQVRFVCKAHSSLSVRHVVSCAPHTTRSIDQDVPLTKGGAGARCGLDAHSFGRRG